MEKSRIKDSKCFESFKSELLDNDSIKAIVQNDKSQTLFNNALASKKFSIEEWLELIEVVTNSQIKSFLLIHLLSRKDYLLSLKGESVLNRLNKNDRHTPSRLNALVRQIDIATLSTDLIEKLEPEAAISLLFSVHHFHHLSEEQVNALLRKYPKPEVIIYWLNHFYDMPNAYCVMAHLFKLADSYVFNELIQMDLSKIDYFINIMVAHLDVFKPTHKFLQLYSTEHHLNLAIQLFINGHHHPSYLSYISLIATKLLAKKHSFSDHSLKLLMALNGFQTLDSIQDKINELINRFIRTKAQVADIDLFYDQDGLLNKACLSQTIRPATKPTPSDSMTTPQENPTVTELSRRNKLINVFDYFLTHYTGPFEPIAHIINDYLSQCTAEISKENKSKSIYHLSILMLQPTMNDFVREALFLSFLQHPELLDEQICYSLFLYNATRAIQYFGLKGGESNYQLVIKLCNEALKRLEPTRHQPMIEIARKAIKEAQLEQYFSQKSFYLDNFINHIKRCWWSGWQGFFQPNLPFYILPYSIIPDTRKASHITNIQERSPLLKLIALLLKDLTTDTERVSLDNVVELIQSFELKSKPDHELFIRTKINDLFHQLLQIRQDDLSMEIWLAKHENLFITNRFHLIEHFLAKDSLTEINLLIDEISADSHHHKKIIKELRSPFPEQRDEAVVVPSESDSPGLLSTASDYISTAWMWTSSRLFAKENSDTSREVYNPSAKR